MGKRRTSGSLSNAMSKLANRVDEESLESLEGYELYVAKVLCRLGFVSVIDGVCVALSDQERLDSLGDKEESEESATY